MDVKPGYKRTEVGVIPEDWKVVHLSKLGKFKNGINKSSAEFGHGSPFVNLMDVFGVNSIKASEEFGLVETNNEEQHTYDMKKGDVMFIRSSVKPSGVGLTAVVEEDLPNTVYSGFIIRFRDNGDLDNGFKRHCFHEESFRKRVIGASSVSANTNINQDNLKRLPLPLPPTFAEQQAIAEALSDTDALIESLEQLLIKKRQVKKGAMQELLTGRKRLPGFSEEWQITEIGCVGDIRNGATPSTQISTFWNGPIPWCTPTDITVTPGKYLFKTERCITPGGLASCGALLLPAGALLLCSRATIGEIKIATLSVCTNQGFKSLVCKDGVSNEFMYYLLLTLKPEMLKRASGSTFLELSKNDLATIEVMLPSFSEQIAIGTILSDMDAEIATLEAKLSKAYQIKQGMMQELLTGRIRLI